MNGSAIFAFIGGLSGLVAVLTFIFAARRDRQSHLMQIAVQRTEELRSSIEQFISADCYLKSLEKVDDQVANHYADRDVGAAFQTELRKHLLERRFENAKAHAEQTRAFVKAVMLLKLSYQGKASEDLMLALGKENIDASDIMEKAAQYIQAERSRITAGRPPIQRSEGV